MAFLSPTSFYTFLLKEDAVLKRSHSEDNGQAVASSNDKRSTTVLGVKRKGGADGCVHGAGVDAGGGRAAAGRAMNHGTSGKGGEGRLGGSEGGGLVRGESDVEAAARWLAAAEIGDAFACFQFGLMCKLGRGVPKDQIGRAHV